MNEAALKARLKIIAQEKLKTFNEIWKQLLLERFLARLSHSTHREQFIFKGGLLLAQYIDLGRETTDIDLSMTKMKSEFSAIEHALCEIIAVSIDDSFRFVWDTMQILSQPHMEYTGFRATIQAYFGNMKDKIHIDIGVGDMVVPNEKDYRPFEYNGKPLFVGEITLYLVSNDMHCSAERLYEVYQKRWRIEEFHKSIKQNASLEKSPTKKVKTQCNHVYAAMIAYCKLEMLKFKTGLNHFAIKYKLIVRANQVAMQELKNMAC